MFEITTHEVRTNEKSSSWPLLLFEDRGYQSEYNYRLSKWYVDLGYAVFFLAAGEAGVNENFPSPVEKYYELEAWWSKYYLQKQYYAARSRVRQGLVAPAIAPYPSGFVIFKYDWRHDQDASRNFVLSQLLNCSTYSYENSTGALVFICRADGYALPYQSSEVAPGLTLLGQKTWVVAPHAWLPSGLWQPRSWGNPADIRPVPRPILSYLPDISAEWRAQVGEYYSRLPWEQQRS